MKKIFLSLIILISGFAFGQCEDFSKEIFDIIKSKEYDKFDNYLQSVEQQRKLLHWTDNKETNDILMSLKDSLKSGIIKSAIELRNSYSIKNCDFDQAKFIECRRNSGRMSELEIVFKICDSLKKIFIQTIQTDKIYISLPINIKAPELPKFTPTKEDLENSTIIIAGEKFKNIEATETEKKKGMEILKNCIKDRNTLNQNIVFVDGMKDKNNIILLTYMCYDKSNMKRYRVNLEKEICEEE